MKMKQPCRGNNGDDGDTYCVELDSNTSHYASDGKRINPAQNAHNSQMIQR